DQRVNGNRLDFFVPFTGVPAMMLSTAIRKTTTHPVPGSWRDRRRRLYRPRLEALESRTLLSVCTVDRLTDNQPAGGGEGGNGMGDLRWCVIESLSQADAINFSVIGTINLAGALPDLTHGVNIEGPGADFMTVRRDTGGDYRIVTVASGATVLISGLTIAN